MPKDGEDSSLRDLISENFDKAEEIDEKSTSEPAVKTEPVKESVKTDEEVVKAETVPAEGEKKPLETEKKDEVKAGEPEKKTEESEKVTPATKPPGSWTPAAREKWAALPSDVQREVLKRERDIANGFTEIGKIRQFGQGMHELWTPFQHIIAAEGGDPMKTTRDLFVTAAALYHGTPVQKAQTISSLIKTFGVDIKTLDSMLAGEVVEGAGPTSGSNVDAVVTAAVNRAMQPVLQGQQQLQQQQVREVESELEAFASDPKNEFFNDVQETMADLMEMANKRGQTLDLQSAYNRAILLHDDISKVVQERTAREKAAAANKEVAAARKKAVSVTGAPAQASHSVENASLRGDLESAIAQLET